MARRSDEEARPVDELRPCRYSEETVTGCRNYLPVSQHGGFPGAAACRLAVQLPSSDYIRHTVCRRSGADRRAR